MDIKTVGVIGAGFSGICMGIQLKKAGIERFTIYERADEPGGVWRDNTYPGAACDIPSFLYSFSFEQRSDWSKKYPEQSEILEYLHSCVAKYSLRRHVRFGSEVASAVYDEESATWILKLANGDVARHRVVVFACGQLNRPLVPELPGLAKFRGTIFHSAQCFFITC